MKCVTAASSRQCHTSSFSAPDQTWRRRSTHCRCGCCQLADIVWHQTYTTTANVRFLWVLSQCMVLPGDLSSA